MALPSGPTAGSYRLTYYVDQNGTCTTGSDTVSVSSGWTDGSKAKALANLGGGPRPTPKFEKGVPIYFHDYFGAGKHAMVVSMKSGEFKAAPGTFREEKNLTGDESRVAEVKDIAFPAFPDVVDDLPPATIITSVSKKDGKLVVRGSTIDNSTGGVQTLDQYIKNSYPDSTKEKGILQSRGFVVAAESSEIIASSVMAS